MHKKHSGGASVKAWICFNQFLRCCGFHHPTSYIIIFMKYFQAENKDKADRSQRKIINEGEKKVNKL